MAEELSGFDAPSPAEENGEVVRPEIGGFKLIPVDCPALIAPVPMDDGVVPNIDEVGFIPNKLVLPPVKGVELLPGCIPTPVRPEAV